jgi:hypothetical protein
MKIIRAPELHLSQILNAAFPDEVEPDGELFNESWVRNFNARGALHRAMLAAIASGELPARSEPNPNYSANGYSPARIGELGFFDLEPLRHFISREAFIRWRRDHGEPAPAWWMGPNDAPPIHRAPGDDAPKRRGRPKGGGLGERLKELRAAAREAAQSIGNPAARTREAVARKLARMPEWRGYSEATLLREIRADWLK